MSCKTHHNTHPGQLVNRPQRLDIIAPKAIWNGRKDMRKAAFTGIRQHPLITLPVCRSPREVIHIFAQVRQLRIAVQQALNVAALTVLRTFRCLRVFVTGAQIFDIA
ncbi:MAG: hypothetical protein ABI690_34370 [Chloroflexota bacterium]